MATIGLTINNVREVVLTGREKVYVPRVALATSCATLKVDCYMGSDMINSGVVATITCNNISIKLVMGSDGKATMSLCPFIMNAVKNALNSPLVTNKNNTTITNPWRGFLELTIAIDSNEDEVVVPFIYGGANPYAPVSEEWRDYIADELGTWATFDLASWYDDNGEILEASISDWQKAFFNLNNWVTPMVTGDTYRMVGVALFFGNKILFTRVKLNLRYDCRSENVMMVKWLDARGGINSRLLTFAGESESGGTANTYERFHWDKVADTQNDGYWHGLDKWAQRTATKQITLGDDNISQNQFSWLSGLVQSACIEVYKDGIWQRANIVDSAIERDPRKSTFSLTITLNLAPDYEPQQF